METPQNFQPLDRRKVYEQVAAQLLAQIGAGRLAAGDPLPPERELTETFRVGRSSIREALRMLESQGVISANGGTFVVADAANPLNSSLQLVFALDSETGIHDLFELRRIIDCEAAALAAERRRDVHLHAMSTAITEMEDALAANNDRDERFIAADMRFHLATAEATGNRLIVYSMQAARDVVTRALEQVVHVPRSPESAIVEHRAVLEAIQAHNPDWARNAMREHLERVERDAKKGLSNG